MKYPKINSIYKRDENGRFTNDYSTAEIEYLKDNKWIGTEKIDGTNIRLYLDGFDSTMKGRTDKAQILPALEKVLSDILCKALASGINNMVLYGEGYGNKIQMPTGNRYLPEKVDFILFDVYCNGYWLERSNIKEIADTLNVKCVPEIFSGTLKDAEKFVSAGFNSTIGSAKAEGLVLFPEEQLFNRCGERIITKLKTKDYRGME